MTSAIAGIATGLHLGNCPIWKYHAGAIRDLTDIPSTFHINTEQTIMNTETQIADAGTATATDTAAAPVRILKTASCPSLSGKSMLAYNIGADSAGQIQFQVVANTGGGYFNDDWVTQSDLRSVLQQQPKDITSATFRSLYPSKSNNSPGFLLAVLRHIGLVGTMATRPRCCELLDPTAFIAEVNALLESAPALELAPATELVATADAPSTRKTLTLKGKPKKT